MSEVVADASPLIALQQIGSLHFLEPLFGGVLVPPAVAREIAPSVPPAPFIEERALAQPIAPAVLRSRLGPGESEAISLALELSAEHLIVDERQARRVAGEVGVPIIGTLGLLLAAKRKGLVPAVRPPIEALLGHGFHVGQEWIQVTLEAAGEADEE